MAKDLSDHAAIALRVEGKNWGMKPFRFINAWLDHPGLRNEIKEMWGETGEGGWKGFVIQKKLAKIRKRLGVWNRTTFGNVMSKLKEAKREEEKLDLLQEQRNLSTEEQLRKSALKSRIWQLENQEERIWHQKSRVNWLKAGDQNTKYFHRAATWRSKKNSIDSLFINGRRVEEPEELKREVRSWFVEHFSSKKVQPWSAAKIQFGEINQQQKEDLERKISKEEILLSLRECEGNKAPGPDGFNISFYKRFWNEVKPEVEGFIEEFSENGRLTREINQTFIALIPKVSSPQSLGDFRPISLVTSIYKILAKCLAKRLSSVLPHLISPNQSAFLANRSILDGIMITNELIHSIRRDKRRALIVKLDFSKAYDSVSWEYLDQIQQRMGFGVKWRQWIHECISTPKLAVLINGSPTKEFSMERGLRQGDPLSPFLFLIAAEGLSRMLSKAKELGILRGVEWVKEGERMNHLQYADDTIIFCDAEMEEIKTLRRILKSFEAASGLRINFTKSKCVGIGVKEDEVQGFAKELGCDTGCLPMEYLGIPVGANPGRVKTWEPIINKFKMRLALWKSSNLSMAGRLVLVKAALCNLPVYYTSLFKMPVQVVAQLERLQRRFLWGSNDKRRKIHYVKWEKIKKPKTYGGLGIQGLAEKNSSLLARWWWRLVTSRDGLWRKMILEKYTIKDCHNLNEEKIKARSTSKSWKDIISVVKGNSEVGLAFREGISVKLGKGNMLRF
ncbi:hypothetical protein QQ045_028811 [Rhodiola kirilowii]